MAFQPGRSGNPGGRPKVVAEVRELAREHSVQALKALAQIATRGKSEAARVSAASAILDRGWGKAPQVVTGEGGEGPMLANITVEFVQSRGSAEGEG